MRLAGVELVHVDLPFRQDIGTAAGVHRMRPLLFVRVVAEEAEGRGECAAAGGRTGVAAARGGPRAPPAARPPPAARAAPRLCRATWARGGQLPTGPEVSQLF